MIAIAHFIAVTFYLGAAAVAALPFARRVKAPVVGVVVTLLLGVGAHATALAGLTQQSGAASLTGLGPVSCWRSRWSSWRAWRVKSV